MDAARWERIQTLFHTVSDLPNSEQMEALKKECGNDTTLFDEVLALLEGDRKASPVLDRGVGRLANEILDGPAASETYQQIGPYKILKILGEGGMGTVFLAERSDLGIQAAIKILRDAWLSPARRERFSLEQRMLAQLDHPNIARLLDADTLTDGTPFFVMEYVDGVPLDRYCQEHGCSIRERVQLFRAVCEAVQFAHQHAVIHRDLKPSNILVKADGTVKLLDFGIAKHLDNFDDAADLTKTGLRLLTPAYASPEQIRGDRTAIHTDVYSLGVILYQLLTGRLPFDLSNRTPAEAALILVEHQPVRPSLVARRVFEQSAQNGHVFSAGEVSWADLDVLCLTAMHKDTQKRYPSTEALMRDIDHYLRGEPLDARPDTLGYRISKFLRRNRVAVTASMMVFAVVTVLVIFFMVRLTRERNTALAEAERTQRIQRFMVNLFQGGDKEAGPANDLRVSTLIDRGEQEAKVLDQDPMVQAELYQTLGDIYQKLGRFDRADVLLNAALERRRSIASAQGATVAENLVALGLLRADQANFAEAERLVREGLEMSKRALPLGHPSIAAATDALGRVIEEKGEYDQAIPILEEAVRLRSAPGASAADLAASLHELASVHFYAGHYQESEALNHRVLAMNRQLYGAQHPRVAETLVNLGAIQQDLGHYQEAEKLHREALQITRSFYGENHYRTASNLTMVARALVFEKRYDEAADLLRQSLAIQERVFGNVHPRVASAVNELGTVALMQEHFNDAEIYYKRMAEIYRGIYNRKHYLIGIALSNQGAVDMARKNNAAAEQFFRQAIDMFLQTLPADHLNIAIARIKLGRTLLRQKRYVSAEGETLAGYQVLMKQVNPSVSWLNSARTDLGEIYDALQQPEKASSFRKELAQVRK